MSHQMRPTLAPAFLSSLGWIALLGSAALLIGNVVGSIVVPDHDWIADTVSDLAAGRFEIIQDVALYGYAGALLALALGTAHVHDGAFRWTALTFILVLLALCVVIIGARNEYGDGDSEGLVIHIYIVYVMGALFAGCFILMGLVGDQLSGRLRIVSWCVAVLWCVGAPIFFLMPTGYDGLWERGLGVVSLVWVVTYGCVLLQVSRDCQGGNNRNVNRSDEV